MQTSAKAGREQYVFANQWAAERARLGAAEDLLDAGTVRLLQSLGVRAGWRCLEVGAGAGSIARWLCREAGPGGHVAALDIDTRFLEEIEEPDLEVQRHDLRRDELPDGAYDLVHGRLVLEHLPERDAVLARLVRALKPGGRLLLEAVDYVTGMPVSRHGAGLFRRTLQARLRFMREAGLDPEYGRRLPAAFRSQGLVEVGSEGRVWVMQGGSAGARWFRLSMEHLRPRLLADGRLAESDVDGMLALFDDPRFAAWTPVIVAAWGRART